MNRKNAVTSRDLARVLGVSQSMVSRAFDPHGRVSPDKRAHILEAAEALGYRPNVIARSLMTRRSGIVAIVMSGFDNPFYAMLLDVLASALDEAGLRSLLFKTPPGEDADSQIPHLRQYNVDALIVASASVSSRIASEWQRDARRIVLINRTIADPPVASVCCDNAAGARWLADVFVDQGHRRVVYVAGPQHTSTNRERETNFISRLMERGQLLSGRVDAGEYSFAAGYEAAHACMVARPDAIFFANDILALGGMDYLRFELGVRIPEDISVVGFDDIPMAAWAAYNLTTVRQPVAAMVEAAMAVITGGGEGEGLRRLPGELVARGSTRGRL